MEMLKRDTEIAMRTHFEIFKHETEGNLGRKVEQKELKPLLQGKVSTTEFYREMDHMKSQLLAMSREMAVAGLGSNSNTNTHTVTPVMMANHGTHQSSLSNSGAAGGLGYGAARANLHMLKAI